MLLGQILHRNLITPDLRAQSKMDAIEELVDLLVQAHGGVGTPLGGPARERGPARGIPASLREHVIEVVAARERTLSTGMEHGVALPHGSTDRLTEAVGALGISRNGIPFECRDGLPAKILILLVVPKDKLDIHIRTLAGIAQLLNDAGFRKTLLDAPDSDAILRLLREAERANDLPGHLSSADRPPA